MSTQDAADDETDGDGPGRREVAHRVFAAEYDDATLSYTEGEEERAPTYVVTPSGAKANRLFLTGVLTEVERVNDEMLRARVVDPTGAFVVYAGQYQPEARATFERTSPPAFVAVAGKARTFSPDDGDRVFSSVRPESVNIVDDDTRDRWVVETARATLRRVGEAATAIRTGDHGSPTSGVALALDHYGTTPGYLAALRDLAVDAARVVANDREEVRALTLAPDDDSHDVDLAELAAVADDHDRTDGVDAADHAATTDDDVASDPSGATDGTDPSSTAAPSSTDPDGTVEELDVDDDVASFTDDTTDVGDFEPGDIDGENTAPAGDEVSAEDELYEMDEAEREHIESEYGTEFSTGTEVDGPGEADIETSGPAPDEEDTAKSGLDDPVAGTAGTADTGAENDGVVTGDNRDTETRDADTDDEGDAVGDETDRGDEATVDDAKETGTDTANGEETAPDPTESDTDGDAAGEADGDADEVRATPDLDEVLLDRMRDLDEGDGADRDELVTTVSEATGADADAVEDAIQDALMSGQCYEPGDDRLKPI